MEKRIRKRKTVEQLLKDIEDAKARIELAKLRRILRKERRT